MGAIADVNFGLLRKGFGVVCRNGQERTYPNEVTYSISFVCNSHVCDDLFFSSSGFLNELNMMIAGLWRGILLHFAAYIGNLGNLFASPN